ncbi:unnamed protein product [Rotaria socialis]|uniref:Methyltransferase FkbM domain-containing protein n=1 Tax=Rotaria socialis TaxID=392032 RepID=A0A820ZY73_9BILA|nr:unnamed protein product [Rotaria socialis]CAF4570050.1 unnamed protein product [Rotaria socialis]
MQFSNSRINRAYLLVCIGIAMIFYISITSKVNHGSYSGIFSIIINTYSGSMNTTNLFDNCSWEFDHYSPSAWEHFWYNNITYLQNKVCSKLNEYDQLNKSIRSLEYIKDLQKRIFSGPLLSNKYDELFSKMYYRSKCSNSQKSDRLVSQYIEPLIGLLRDPLSICSYSNIPASVAVAGYNAVQSKRFFLLGPSAPYENFQTSTPSIAPWLHQPGSKKVLFDIGCSLFNGVDNPVKVSSTIGIRWFYEYFGLNSLSFDRIVAFEAIPYPPKKYWQQIPDDIIGILTFINIGVEVTGKTNPWGILKSIAKPNDYVIIKLDIDTAPLENALVQQILNDSSISSLIDEMFFEMHVTINEMRRFWGTPPGELKDTYILFTKLRQLGIRMHSWP